MSTTRVFHTSYRYYKLDVTKNLRKNLSYKTVMEYPVLHVCVAGMTPTEYVIYDPAVDTGELLCSRMYRITVVKN